MFNEAFWFFYWVGVVGDISAALGAIFVITLIAAGFWAFIGAMQVDCNDMKPETYKKGLKLFVLVACVCFAIDIVVPNENALYAGAGQYVAESTEIDDTLLKLKDLIDKKIEETASD